MKIMKNYNYFCKRFIRARGGNVAVIFGMMLVPSMVMIGGLVDYGMALKTKSQLTATLDNAMLAAMVQYSDDKNIDYGKIVTDYIDKNFTQAEKSRHGTIIEVTAPTISDSGEMSATVYAQVPTNFLKLASFNHFDFNVKSGVMVGGSSIEVALVLDNTGSMAGSKITALKGAANELLDIILPEDKDNSDGKIKFSVVPFADYVNVGLGNRNEGGLDIPEDYRVVVEPEKEVCVEKSSSDEEDKDDDHEDDDKDDDHEDDGKEDDHEDDGKEDDHEDDGKEDDDKDDDKEDDDKDDDKEDDDKDDDKEDDDKDDDKEDDDKDDDKEDDDKDGVKDDDDVKDVVGGDDDDDDDDKDDDKDDDDKEDDDKDDDKEDDDKDDDKEDDDKDDDKEDDDKEDDDKDDDKEDDDNDDDKDDDDDKDKEDDDDDKVCKTTPAKYKYYKWHGCVGSREHDLNTRDEGYATGVPGIMSESNWCQQIAPVTRLTTDRDLIATSISNMSARRSTYIPGGLAWGWRSLSPQAPFADGASYSDNNVRKVIVLMSDGANTRSTWGKWNGLESDSKEWKQDLGRRASRNKSDVYGHNGTNIVNANAITAELCTNIKKANIRVYTVGFNVASGSGVESMLQSCAGNGGKYYAAGDGTTLADAFKRIGRSLLNLRLTH